MQASNAIFNGTKGASGLAVKVVSGNYECSGAIWKENIVITAAHCVIDSSGVLKTNIRVGKVSTFGEWIYSDVAGVKVPKEYNPSTVNLYGQTIQSDIAFLILRKVLDLQPLSLDLRIANSSDWEKYTQSPIWLEILGYGNTSQTETTVPTTSPVSGMFSLDSYSSAGKRKDWGLLNSVTSVVCRGDSGGPVIYYRAEEKALVLVGIVTATTGTTSTLNCGNSSSTVIFTKLSSYSGLAASTLITEARYRPAAIVLDSGFENLDAYKDIASDLIDYAEQLPPATKKRLVDNNKNVSSFFVLIEDYEIKLNDQEEQLNQSMEFTFINSGVLEANSRSVGAGFEASLKPFQIKIDALLVKIGKTLPEFVCTSGTQTKDLPSNKKCPKGYKKTELTKPF